ncbi:MAG: hypothetical protein IJ869_04670 [Clostridiales bacterium]|nr:hypothetical protein [Clostridiales bacterium]
MDKTGIEALDKLGLDKVVDGLKAGDALEKVGPAVELLKKSGIDKDAALAKIKEQFPGLSENDLLSNVDKFFK